MHFDFFPGTYVPGSSCIALRAGKNRYFKKRKRGKSLSKSLAYASGYDRKLLHPCLTRLKQVAQYDRLNDRPESVSLPANFGRHSVNIRVVGDR